MKKTLHWINIIICFLLLGLGIIMVVYGGSGAEINTDTGIFRLMGIVQILMAMLVWCKAGPSPCLFYDLI